MQSTLRGSGGLAYGIGGYEADTCWFATEGVHSPHSNDTNNDGFAIIHPAGQCVVEYLQSEEERSLSTRYCETSNAMAPPLAGTQLPLIIDSSKKKENEKCAAENVKVFIWVGSGRVLHQELLVAEKLGRHWQCWKPDKPPPKY